MPCLRCHYPISGTLNCAFALLFSFPSRYSVRYRSWGIFSVGSLYSRLYAPKQGHITLERSPRLYDFAYRAITVYDGVFQLTSARRLAFKKTPKHHISTCLAARIRFALDARSVALLTQSLLISFPLPTKIFQFRRFPPLSRPFGDPRFAGCMLLAGAYRSLPRPSSVPKPNHPLDSV